MSASESVMASFFLRKPSRTRLSSSGSLYETNDESTLCKAMPQWRTMPAIASSSAFGSYFLTSAAQSVAIGVSSRRRDRIGGVEADPSTGGRQECVKTKALTLQHE